MPDQAISLYSTTMNGNGLDRVILNLAKQFCEEGCKVDIVVPNLSEYQIEATKDFHSDIRNIELSNSNSDISPVLKIFKIRKYLLEEKPSVFFANNDFVGVSNIANSMCRRHTKIVHGVHTSVPKYFESLKSIKSLIRKALISRFYPQSDGIIAVSKGAAEDLSEITGISLGDIKVIYNPIVTKELEVQASFPITHPWFDEKEMKPVILSAGRIMPSKGYKTLIEAFANVRKSLDCRLIIIGYKTEYENKLLAFAEELGVRENLSMPGFQDNPYAYMAKSSVFVMSSEYEGFCNVLAEAMATGTPVVSTDCRSGPAEILKNGKYGALVPVGDSRQLAQGILDTLSSSINSEELKQRANDFHVKTIAKQYLEYFHSL